MSDEDMAACLGGWVTSAFFSFFVLFFPYLFFLIFIFFIMSSFFFLIFSFLPSFFSFISFSFSVSFFLFIYYFTFSFSFFFLYFYLSLTYNEMAGKKKLYKWGADRGLGAQNITYEYQDMIFFFSKAKEFRKTNTYQGKQGHIRSYSWLVRENTVSCIVQIQLNLSWTGCLAAV